ELKWHNSDGFASGRTRRRGDVRGNGEILERGDDLGCARGTTRGIFFEAAEDELVERAREAGLERAGGRGSAGSDVVHDREHARAGEGRLAGDGVVEDGAERKDVGAAIEMVAARLFGGHVGDGADDDAGVGELCFAGV